MEIDTFFRSFVKTSSLARSGREEEAHEADLFGPANFRAGEDVRADKVFGGAGAGQAGICVRHDRITSEGKKWLN